MFWKTSWAPLQMAKSRLSRGFLHRGHSVVHTITPCTDDENPAEQSRRRVTRSRPAWHFLPAALYSKRRGGVRYCLRGPAGRATGTRGVEGTGGRQRGNGLGEGVGTSSSSSSHLSRASFFHCVDYSSSVLVLRLPKCRKHGRRQDRHEHQAQALHGQTERRRCADRHRAV